MDEAGLHPAAIAAPEDIQKIPPTRKMHYRRNFPAGVLAAGKTLNERGAIRSHSSGTGGERLVTVAPIFTLAERMSTALSVNPPVEAVLLRQSKRRTCRYAAPNCSDVECANPRSTMADRILADGTLVLPVHHDLLATTEPMIEQAIRELEEYDPQWLYIDPTHLAFLIRHMRRRGVKPPPVSAITFTYTSCTGVARRQIEEFFPRGLPMGEVVSMSEFGWVAMECRSGRMHMNTRSFFVELMCGPRPAQPGDLSELYLTSLGDRLSPHIRYQTGDFYRPLREPCPCGHPFPVVRCEGRGRDMIVREGQVVLTPAGLDDLVGRAPWLDVYRLHQKAEDHFVFWFIPNEHFEAAHERELHEALRVALGEGARIELDRTSYIASERSGKFLSCTSAVSAESW
jgi:phenylacetate-CoA ligase